MEAPDAARIVTDRLVGGSRKGGDGRDDGDDDRKKKLPVEVMSDADEAVATDAAGALFELMKLLESELHPYGFNQDIWLERYTFESPELSELVEQIMSIASPELQHALQQEEDDLIHERASVEHMRRLARKCRDMYQTLMVFLANAQRLYRELQRRRAAEAEEKSGASNSSSSSSTNEGGFNFVAALEGLEANHDKKKWLAAVKETGKGAKCIYVDADLINRIKSLFEQYSKDWDAASVDGFKGMKVDKFRRMTAALEEIIGLLVSSGNILTHASIGPGSAFFDMMLRLLKQSCGSREVLTLAQWWISIAKPTKK